MTMMTTPFTLADTVAEVEAHSERWNPMTHRQMLAGLRKVAGLLGKRLEDLPADPVLLKAMIEGRLNWRACGYRNARTFGNMWRRALKAVRETRHGGLPDFPGRTAYSPAWQAFMADLDAAIARGDEAPWTRKSLWHLIGYANWRGIEMSEVTSDVLAELIELHAECKRVIRSHGVKPKSFARQAVDAARTWNRLVREKNEKPWLNRLPATILEWDGTRKRVNLPLTEYPRSFQDEVDAYFRTLRLEPGAPSPDRPSAAPDDEFGAIRDAVPESEHVNPDIVTNRRRWRPVGDERIESLQGCILQAAGALVRRGEARVEDIRSLRDVTTLPALKVSLTDYKDRLEAEGRFDPTTASRYRHADDLIRIAKWAGWHDGHIVEMKKILNLESIKTESVGNMSFNRRRLLEQFDHPWAVEAWHRRPAELLERAEAQRRANGAALPTSITDVEVCILLEMVRVLPARRANLALVRYRGEDRNLFLARHKGERSWVEWGRGSTKNRRRLRAPLSPEAERAIRTYLEVYRPRYLECHPETPDSEFLFPGTASDKRGNGHRDLRGVGTNFADRMDEVGITMTLHLNRHLIAQIVLDHDPSLLNLVADLLADKVETVKRFYIDDRTAPAAEKLRAIFAERMSAMTERYRTIEWLAVA